MPTSIPTLGRGLCGLHARRSADHGQRKTRKRKWTLGRSIKVYLYLSISAHLVITCIYEPLRDAGVVDDIANSTVFRVIPSKQVEPPNAVDNAIYKPITRDKEIRLLVLEPGAPDAEIRCHLIHVQQGWRTRYEALSYAWGDESITRPLMCSGHSVNVHVSLHDALSDLRHPTRERVLWVDRLCINQADNVEKAKQVMLMSDIYSRAQRVLIYLGRLDASAQGAMAAIERLDKRLSLVYLVNLLQDSIFSMMAWSLVDKREAAHWNQIVQLLRRPWFQRLWVIQETVLAQKAQVICGGQSTSWATLERVVTVMETYHIRVQEIPDYDSIRHVTSGVRLIAAARSVHHPGIIMPDDRLWHWFTKGTPIFGRPDDEPQLLDLVVNTRPFLCKDPCDRIFGLLGMTRQDTANEHIGPNYGIPAEQVFRNFVLWDIFSNGSLRVLGTDSNKTRSHSASPVPSWVPDFDRLEPNHSLTGKRNLDRFDASAGLPVQAWTSGEATVLHLRGKIVDTLHSVGKRQAQETRRLVSFDGMFESDSQLQAYERLQVNRSMMEEARDIWLDATKRWNRGHCSTPEAGEILLNKNATEKDPDNVPSSWSPFLRALVFDRNERGERIDDLWIDCVIALVRLTLQGPSTPKWYRQNFVIADFANEVLLSFAPSRRFAGTDRGLIGYVPRTARKGDLVCILYGAEVPFVLRRVAENKYALVGECYMHGIMHGEALKMGSEDADVVFDLV